MTCLICNKEFEPIPQQGERQKLCGSEFCRKMYQNEWQRQNYYKRKAGAIQRLKDKTPRAEEINTYMQELSVFCVECTPEQAAQIEDNIRLMLLKLVPKSDKYLGIRRKKAHG